MESGNRMYKSISRCENCYAEVMAKRLQAMGVKGYENAFKLTLQPHRLEEPLQRKKIYSILCKLHE